MARILTATPAVRGADAKRIFGVMSAKKEVARSVVVLRTKKLVSARKMFGKVTSKNAGI